MYLAIGLVGLTISTIAFIATLRAGLKGSVYLHILGLTIPLVIRTSVKPIKPKYCCVRFDAGRKLHGRGCEVRKNKVLETPEFGYW